MRFHLPALPGRSTAPENSTCAYSQKIRKFVAMMEPRGHECLVYEVEGEELPFDPALWAEANAEQAEQIKEDSEPGDFLCITAGACQRSLADAVPLLAVEYGVGYGGVFTDLRVFESYAWMHLVYGAQAPDAHAADGRFYDAVIPNFFLPAEFEFSANKDDYLLYLGRMVERKGVQVVADIGERLGMPVLYAGEGDAIPEYGEYLGPVGPEQRARLLTDAYALIAPTLYVEPFGGVVAEAGFSGTPVVTTDWGAFVETVDDGVTGFRCRDLHEFCEAVEATEGLSPAVIRDHAWAKWSTTNVAPQYEAYFERLDALRAGDGWYRL